MKNLEKSLLLILFLILPFTISGQTDSEDKVLVPKTWLREGAKQLLKGDSAIRVGKIYLQENKLLRSRVLVSDSLISELRSQIRDQLQVNSLQERRYLNLEEELANTEEVLDIERKNRRKYKRQRNFISLGSVVLLVSLIVSK